MVSAAAEYEHKGVAAAATPLPYASHTRTVRHTHVTHRRDSGLVRP